MREPATLREHACHVTTSRREKQFAHLPAPLAGALDDREAWVVGTILRLQGTLRYMSAAARDEYVPLAARPFLKPALGAYYQDVMDSLISGV